MSGLGRPTRESPEITETYNPGPVAQWQSKGRPTRESPEITETLLPGSHCHVRGGVAPPENRQRLLKRRHTLERQRQIEGRPTRESPEITETVVG